MVDNFDTNVARRMPNVASKSKPRHPWDVVIPPTDDDPDDDGIAAETDGDSGPPVTTEPEPSAPLKSDVTPDSGVERTTNTEEDERSFGPVSREHAPKIEETSLNVPDVRKKQEKHELPAPSKKASDLSNTISIHSNYCKLDNDISDHLFPRLSPSSQCVYLRLYRQSFGWNRNWAAESLPKLAKSCNLSLQTVRKAIKELETLGCIRKDFSDYHKATVYRIFLPAEIGYGNIKHTNNAMTVTAGLISDTPNDSDEDFDVPFSQVNDGLPQDTDGSGFGSSDMRKLDPRGMNRRGQNTVIQSIYFSGASIYSLLEGDGPLPKNISIYITDTHLRDAVAIVDEFYDSIGFSIVSRAVYRKSIIDYFDLIRSGFTGDDVRYAVRWTFKNSRSRPESFSLIKHTMHLAMDDLISELKNVSGEKDTAREKREALKRTVEDGVSAPRTNVSTADLALWEKVVEELRNDLNDHSFKAFIEPLKLVSSEDGKLTLDAPSDSLSWIVDHYRDIIADRYRNISGKDAVIEFV